MLYSYDVLTVVHVSFAEQLLYISEGAGGVDVCLKMRGFTEISLSASIATSAQTALGEKKSKQ